MHPAWLRCESLKYPDMPALSRLARRALQHLKMSIYFYANPKSSRKEKFRASIKAMRLQDNPWKHSTCFSIGKKFEGKVKKKTSFGYLIQIEAGVLALLPISDENIKEELTLNTTIKVKMEKIDVELEKIEVSLLRSL